MKVDHLRPSEPVKLTHEQAGKHVYMLKLVLTDSTGSLPALLSDGETFFGVAAADKSQGCMKRLTMMLETLSKPESLIDCCLAKYKTPQGIVKYQIFGTSICHTFAF